MIVQLIPAVGWYAKHEADDEVMHRPLVAWGLTDEGVVVGLIEDYNVIEDAMPWAVRLGDTWLGYTNVPPEADQ